MTPPITGIVVTVKTPQTPGRIRKPGSVRTAQDRFNDVVGMAVVHPDLIDLEMVVVEPWHLAQLAEAEASIRQLRHKAAAHRDGSVRPCGQCGKPVIGRADRKWCSDGCRQAAHRAKRTT